MNNTDSGITNFFKTFNHATGAIAGVGSLAFMLIVGFANFKASNTHQADVIVAQHEQLEEQKKRLDAFQAQLSNDVATRRELATFESYVHEQVGDLKKMISDDIRYHRSHEQE